MAKTKRDYPTGKLFLKFPSSYERAERYPVYLQYTWNRNVLKKTTGIKCRVMDWDSSGKGALKASFGNNYKFENNKLLALLQKYDNLLFEFSQQHPHQLTTDDVRNILNDVPLTRKDGGRDFIEYTLALLENEYSRNKIGISRLENGKSGLRIFNEFLRLKGKTGLYVGDVTTDIIDEYIKWRREVKQNSNETINHALTPLIKAASKAADEGFLDRQVATALSNMRISIKPSLNTNDEENVKYLTKEEVRNLSSYYADCENPRRKEYLQMFFFSYYGCGLRCIDIMTLRWSDIDFSRRELRKIQVKTMKRHTIPLTEEAISILQFWRNRNTKFVFGLLPDDFDLDDSHSLYLRRNTVEQSINQSLKVIGASLNFAMPLTMHVARHTFAVHALNGGLSMSVVSRLLGHSSTTVTEQIYAQFLPDTLADEVAKLQFSPFIRTT